MKTIDLTTVASCLAFLDSRPDDEIIILRGHLSRATDPESDAVSHITGEPCNNWCASHNRWEWTKKDLIAALIDPPTP